MKPYILQVKIRNVWLDVKRFTDRVEAVAAGRKYLVTWSDKRIARVVHEVVSVRVLWGGIARES